MADQTEASRTHAASADGDPPGTEDAGRRTTDAVLLECVRWLHALGMELDATSIAEAVWLAAAAPVSPADADAPAALEHPLEGRDVAAQLGGQTGQQTARPPSVARTTIDADDGAATAPGSWAAGRLHRVREPVADLGALELGPPLRPFKRRWLDGRRLQFDVEATVRSYARSWKLTPQFRPAPERWFEVVLIVDDSPSMTIWGDLVSVLSTMLRQLGAFRTIRTWHMTVSGPGPRLRNEGGQPVGSGQLRSPGGRRLIIVVSDGSAAGWFEPEVWELIKSWAGSTPTALISPLATRLWNRTGLCLPAVRVGPGAPGSSNGGLTYSAPRAPAHAGTAVGAASGPGEPGGAAGTAIAGGPPALADGGSDDATEPDRRDWLPLPACTLSPYMLGRWARMLMRGDPRGCDALLIPPVLPRPEEGPEHRPSSGADLVDAFRRTASPWAARLALLTAPFSAVNLPLLELLRREVTPGATTADLAEVAIGGLFHPAAPGPEGDREGALLRFRDGVRERLGQLLPERDAWRAYEAIARHVATEAGLSETFTLGVPDPLGNAAIPADLLPLAAASREALEFLDALPARLPDEPVITVAPPTDPAVREAGMPEIRGDLPFRNPYFTGRADILEWLGSTFADHRNLLVLQGPGGVGKSAIAVEYAHRYWADYDLVWWIRSSQATAVRASLAALASRLGLAEQGGVAATADAVLRALERGEPCSRWLLVYDAAGPPEDYRDLLPRCTGMRHVLIVSRDHRWATAAETFAVDVFTRPESAAFLGRRLGKSLTSGDADLLAEGLGDLPIALDQAAVTMDATGLTVDRFLTRLFARVGELLAGDRNLDYPVGLMATTYIALDALREAEPTAYALLRCLSLFSNRYPVPYDLLRVAEQPGSPILSGLPASAPDLARAVEALQRFGLAERDSGAEVIALPPLIAALVRAEMSPAELSAHQHATHLLLAAAAPADPADRRQWPYLGQLAAHVEAANLASCQDAGVRAFALTVLRYLGLSGDPAGSEALARQIVDRWTADSGPGNPDVLTAQLFLSDALRRRGVYAEAANVMTAALTAARRGSGEQAEITLELRRSLGYDLRLRGDFRDALALDRDTLDLHQVAHGWTNPLTLRVATLLGLDLLLCGEYEEAWANLDKAAGRARLAGADQVEALVNARNLLSWARRSGGAYRQAVDISRAAWVSGRASLGAEHRATLRAATGLVISMCRLATPSALEEAASVGTQIADAWRRTAHSDNPDALAALVSLGNVQRERGQLDEARDLAARSYQGYRASFGPDHPVTLGCLGNLALADRLTGNPDAARRHNETALDGHYRRLGVDHACSLAVAVNLASDHADLGESHQARLLGEDALGRARRVLGERHPLTLGCAANLALDLRADGDGDYADRVHATAMSGYLEGLGGGHPDTQAAVERRRIAFDYNPPPLGV